MTHALYAHMNNKTIKKNKIKLKKKISSSSYLQVHVTFPSHIQSGIVKDRLVAHVRVWL
jgi:hypothetical protein